MKRYVLSLFLLLGILWTNGVSASTSTKLVTASLLTRINFNKCGQTVPVTIRINQEAKKLKGKAYLSCKYGRILFMIEPEGVVLDSDGLPGLRIFSFIDKTLLASWNAYVDAHVALLKLIVSNFDTGLDSWEKQRLIIYILEIAKNLKDFNPVMQITINPETQLTITSLHATFEEQEEKLQNLSEAFIEKFFKGQQEGAELSSE